MGAMYRACPFVAKQERGGDAKKKEVRGNHYNNRLFRPKYSFTNDVQTDADSLDDCLTSSTAFLELDFHAKNAIITSMLFYQFRKTRSLNSA